MPRISIERVLTYYDPWGALGIRDDLRTVLRSTPKVFVPGMLRLQGYDYGRIRYLMDNPTKDPIELEVGLPDYYPVVLCDGHHRLIAAHYRKQKFIPANIGGWVTGINWLRGINKRDPWA